MTVPSELNEAADSGKQPESASEKVQQPTYSGNLDDYPDFRSYKSVMNKKLDQIERERATDRQVIAQLRQQLNAKAMEGMDELERERYEKQQALDFARSLQQQVDSAQREADRQRVLFDIHSETGCPMEELESAETPHEAWRIANRFLKGKTNEIVKERVKENLDKQQRNQVDVGGGSAPSAQGDLQSRYDEARKQYDISSQLDIMAEARRAGVTLQGT